jgi:hypothetical protein
LILEGNGTNGQNERNGENDMKRDNCDIERKLDIYERSNIEKSNGFCTNKFLVVLGFCEEYREIEKVQCKTINRLRSDGS